MLRILEEISNLLRPHAGEIRNNAWLIGHIDLVRAKHRFLQDRKGTIPTLSDQGEIQLLQVRHPLIEKAVPNDIHFGKDLTEIVITGPNNGWEDHHAQDLGTSPINGPVRIANPS